MSISFRGPLGAWSEASKTHSSWDSLRSNPTMLGLYAMLWAHHIYFRSGCREYCRAAWRNQASSWILGVVGPASPCWKASLAWVCRRGRVENTSFLCCPSSHLKAVLVARVLNLCHRKCPLWSWSETLYPITAIPYKANGSYADHHQLRSGSSPCR